MVSIDTLEGLIDGALWYHYDVSGDVLYLRLNEQRDAEAVGEETDDGFILLRDCTTNEVVGLTIVNWWARFGNGALPDSISAIQRHIEPLAGKLAA